MLDLWSKAEVSFSQAAGIENEIFTLSPIVRLLSPATAAVTEESENSIKAVCHFSLFLIARNLSLEQCDHVGRMPS